MITIITPTTGNPKLPEAVASSKGIPKHWVVADGLHPFFRLPVSINVPFTPVVGLPENTGKDPETGEVKYYGHRIYSAMSFLVNTEWIYFLDEDNRVSPDFAEKLIPFLQKHSGKAAATFRRKIFTESGRFIGYDDFESIPGVFADTGCVVWNTRFYAENIAHLAFSGWGCDRVMYGELLRRTGEKDPPHLHEYLLEYTAPKHLETFFMNHCREGE